MSNLGFGVKLTSNSNVGVRIVSETADANLSVGVGGVRGLFPINVTPLLGGGGGGEFGTQRTSACEVCVCVCEWV